MPDLSLNPQDQSVVTEIWDNNLSLIQVWESYKLLNLSESLTFKAALDRYIKHLTEAGRSTRYIKEMNYVLCRLEKHLPPGQTLYQVTTKSMWSVLDSLQLGPTARRKVSVFLCWAYNQGMLPVPVKVPGKPSNPAVIGILTVDQVASLINHCPDDLMGHLWLCLCIGLRVAEAIRVDYLGFRDGCLIVGAQASKTRTRRVIEMVNKYQRYAEMIRPQANLRKRMEALRDAANVHDWPRNCMRHTAASHWLNYYKNEHKAAMHLGHSPVMLHRHYKALVTMKETREFFKLW